MFAHMSDFTTGSTAWIREQVGERHPSTEHVLDFFAWDHLPAGLGAVSGTIGAVAITLTQVLPDGPELTVALRKLLEGKDAAVRAALGVELEDNMRRLTGR